MKAQCAEVAQAACALGLPVHLHVAEQQGEVEDCLHHHGRRPIEWLLERMPVDGPWNLVHRTHATPEALRALRSTGASIVLCPTTETAQGASLQAQGRTVSWMAEAGATPRLLGLLAFGDTVKSASAAAIRKSQVQGVRTVLVTGDNRGSAQVAAEQPGIDEIRAEVLPEDKSRIVGELKIGGQDGRDGGRWYQRRARAGRG